MVNLNGELLDSDLQIDSKNRSFLYGDGVFETLKIVNNRILYFEDHYFRLMASMRIIRMKIPMEFTMEFLESEILRLASAQNIQSSARIRITVFRNQGGYYTPEDNSVSYIIHGTAIQDSAYRISKDSFEVDLYKDFIVPKQLLSTLKTTSKITNVTAAIFAEENHMDSVLLINEDKNVIEAVAGNIFMLMGNKLITPPVSEGCLNGIMRKQIISLAKTIDGIVVAEEPVSPFNLQKADELFITNVIIGIQPITRYRKKDYVKQLSVVLLAKLNESLSLG